MIIIYYIRCDGIWMENITAGCFDLAEISVMIGEASK